MWGLEMKDLMKSRRSGDENLNEAKGDAKRLMGGGERLNEKN